MAGAPVQTPCTFVKGGGAAKFSTECENALLACGYDPDSFGDYKHVQNQISAAQARCDRWDNMTDAERRANPQLQPLPSDRHMANCEAGHLSQDAVHREGGSRGNNCGNLNDGYDTDRAPCMPQSRSASTPGSEHNLASRHEMASAEAARRDSGSSDYPADLRNAHERDRIQRVVEHSDPNAPREPISREQWEAARRQRAEESGATPGASGPATAGDDSPGDTAAGDMPSGDEAKAKAAECIDAFREAGLAHMKSEAEEHRANNHQDLQNAYDSRGGSAREDQLRAERDQHATDRDALTPQRDSEQRREASLTRWRDEHQANGDTARATETQGRLDTATTTRANLSAQIDQHETARASADGRLQRLQSWRCEAEEGRRLSADPPDRREERYRAPSTHRGWADSDYGRSDARRDARGLDRDSMGLS